MTTPVDSISHFVDYGKTLKGEENGEVLVTIREGTTLPVSWGPGCNLWVSVGWYPPVWLGRTG